MTAPTTSATGPRSAASGTAPYRALLVGGRATAGDATLVAAFAEALAARSGHGVDVEGIAAAPLAQATSGSLLAGRDLSRIDCVVVVIDPERTRRAGQETLGAVRALLRDVGRRLVAGSALVVVVPSPRIAGLAPHRLDELVAGIRESADSLTPVVRLDDGGPGATATADATRWAEEIATAAASALIAPMVAFLPDDHHDEDLRLDAVDRLPPRDALWVARFQRIVDEARSRYGTSSAALSIIDADHARYAVTAGFETRTVKRGQTICNRVLRTYGGLIVGDAQADPRFERYPDVRSGEVRFYAGYRIESVDGAPLGSLCVFDPTPRDVHDEDLVALRDLAIRAERSLWALQDGLASV